jgi:hypothetical protein
MLSHDENTAARQPSVVRRKSNEVSNGSAKRPLPLLETNAYLSDADFRRRMIVEDAYQSSVFEGAHRIQRPDSSVSKRRPIASAKKPANGSNFSK